jgi:peptidoglycan-associated lipoprotein
MKLTKFASLLVTGLALTLAVGCKRSPTPLTRLPSPGETGPSDFGAAKPLPGEPGSDGTTTAIASNPPGSHEGWPEDTEALKAQTVYFDYDSSAVKLSEVPKVAAVADYLKANADDAVRVEGNCDERGTEEYNRALGERRALAVREKLVALGVSPSRVDTISYGEDRPADSGHNAAAWSKNRRDDFVVLKHPQ